MVRSTEKKQQATTDDCLHDLAKIMACLDRIAAQASPAKADVIALATANLQLGIDLLNDAETT